MNPACEVSRIFAPLKRDSGGVYNGGTSTESCTPHALALGADPSIRSGTYACSTSSSSSAIPFPSSSDSKELPVPMENERKVDTAIHALVSNNQCITPDCMYRDNHYCMHGVAQNLIPNAAALEVGNITIDRLDQACSPSVSLAYQEMLTPRYMVADSVSSEHHGFIYRHCHYRGKTLSQWKSLFDIKSHHPNGVKCLVHPLDSVVDLVSTIYSSVNRSEILTGFWSYIRMVSLMFWFSMNDRYMYYWPRSTDGVCNTYPTFITLYRPAVDFLMSDDETLSSVLSGDDAKTDLVDFATGCTASEFVYWMCVRVSTYATSRGATCFDLDKRAIWKSVRDKMSNNTAVFLATHRWVHVPYTSPCAYVKSLHNVVRVSFPSHASSTRITFEAKNRLPRKPQKRMALVPSPNAKNHPCLSRHDPDADTPIESEAAVGDEVPSVTPHRKYVPSVQSGRRRSPVYDPVVAFFLFHLKFAPNACLMTTDVGNRLSPASLQDWLANCCTKTVDGQMSVCFNKFKDRQSASSSDQAMPMAQSVALPRSALFYPINANLFGHSFRYLSGDQFKNMSPEESLLSMHYYNIPSGVCQFEDISTFLTHPASPMHMNEMTLMHAICSGAKKHSDSASSTRFSTTAWLDGTYDTWRISPKLYDPETEERDRLSGAMAPEASIGSSAAAAATFEMMKAFDVDYTASSVDAKRFKAERKKVFKRHFPFNEQLYSGRLYLFIDAWKDGRPEIGKLDAWLLHTLWFHYTSSKSSVDSSVFSVYQLVSHLSGSQSIAYYFAFLEWCAIVSESCDPAEFVAWWAAGNEPCAEAFDTMCRFFAVLKEGCYQEASRMSRRYNHLVSSRIGQAGSTVDPTLGGACSLAGIEARLYSGGVASAALFQGTGTPTKVLRRTSRVTNDGKTRAASWRYVSESKMVDRDRNFLDAVATSVQSMCKFLSMNKMTSARKVYYRLCRQEGSELDDVRVPVQMWRGGRTTSAKASRYVIWQACNAIMSTWFPVVSMRASVLHPCLTSPDSSSPLQAMLDRVDEVSADDVLARQVIRVRNSSSGWSLPRTDDDDDEEMDESAANYVIPDVAKLISRISNVRCTSRHNAVNVVYRAILSAVSSLGKDAAVHPSVALDPFSMQIMTAVDAVVHHPGSGIDPATCDAIRQLVGRNLSFEAISSMSYQDARQSNNMIVRTMFIIRNMFSSSIRGNTPIYPRVWDQSFQLVQSIAGTVLEHEIVNPEQVLAQVILWMYNDTGINDAVRSRIRRLLSKSVDPKGLFFSGVACGVGRVRQVAHLFSTV